mgnify:CR=1 FL=1
MKKKLCSILLALTMVLTLLPVSALADGGAPASEPTPAETPVASNVAKIGDQEYATLAAAVKEAKEGETVTLAGDVELDTRISITKKITLDLAGHTIKNGSAVKAQSGLFVVDNDGDFTINDSSAEKTGMIDAAAHDSNLWAAVVVWPDAGKTAKLTVNGGTLKGYYYPITGNGTCTDENCTTITINGGKLESVDGLAIYHPQNGQLTVNGGELIGQETAIEMRAGVLTINDGTFTATNKPTATQPNGSGTTTDGAAIAVCQHTTKLRTEVTINGGTFNGFSAFYEHNAQKNSAEDLTKVKLNITGGNFKTINDGTVSVYSQDKTGFISGGTFTDLSALDYLAEGASVTVKLAADTTKDVTIPAGTTVTLDLNGHKLTNASKDTIINNGNLTITGNGTVDNVTHGKAALINYGTATLNDGNYTRSKEDAENNSASAGENSYYTILNDKGGNLTINSAASVTNVGHFSSMIRNGGTAGSQSTLLINGGRFSGGINTVKNDTDGTLTILGGDFSNTTQYVIMNWNIADIYDGTFEANSTASAVLFSASWEGSAGTLNFHGGNVKTTSESQKAILDYYDASHTGKVAVSGGTFTSDPSAYVVPGYVASYNGSTYTVYYPVPVIPNNNNNSSSTTTKNPDGSTTTTTTDKATGAVTETTTTANGSVGTVKTDANGSTEISASISAADVKAAEQKNAPVIAPITVAPAASSAAAPVIKLSVPANAGEVAVAIPVVNAKQGTVAVKVNPDGTEEIIKTAVVTENGLVLGVKGSMQIKVINNDKNFVDTVGHWAASDVDFVSARELFNGTAPALFSPEASMTRGMVVTVIARLAGENTDGGANWYDKGCAWAVANGVSDGTNPNGSITREQLAAMLYRYCGSPAASGSLSAYADAASVSAFGSDAMQWCVNNGIINGMDGLLNPQGQATRAQVSAMFARYIRLAAAK